MNPEADVLFDIGDPVVMVPPPELPPEKPPVVEEDRTQIMEFSPPLAGATISPCGLYRYVLWRKFKSSGPKHLWICLNPSVADAVQDDRSLSKMCAFSKREGAAEIFVCNPFAYRAQKPAAMRKAAESDVDVFGRDNIGYIIDCFNAADMCIVGWGNGGAFKDGGKKVMQVIELENEKKKIPIVCLGLTKQGHPRHPLFVAGNKPLVPFSYWEEDLEL